MSEYEDTKMFCAALLDTKSIETLKLYCSKNSIDNYNKDFHITLVNSEIQVDFEPLADCGIKIPSYNITPAKWVTSDGNTIVVLSLNSKWLEYRFREAKEHGATWSYPEFRPHITLSYDVHSTFDVSKMSKIDFDLYIESEYCEY